MKKISILIVDDNEADRYLLNRDLEETGLEIKTFEAEDGEEALTFFKEYEKNKALYPSEYPPVIVFLDINMPIINGFEFLSEFSTLKAGVALDPCVFMMFSSSENEKDKQEALSYDFVKGYLVKGRFSCDELKEKIESIMASLS